MPAPTLPRQEVLQWLRDGYTQMEIVDMLAARGIHTKQGSISTLKKRHARPEDEAVMRTRTRAEALPWKVRPEHKQLYAAKMLRAFSRRVRGEDMTQDQEQRLDRWLLGLKLDDAVIHYDPDTEEGFWRVPRRHGVDTGPYRDPNIA